MNGDISFFQIPEQKGETFRIGVKSHSGNQDNLYLYVENPDCLLEEQYFVDNYVLKKSESLEDFLQTVIKDLSVPACGESFLAFCQQEMREGKTKEFLIWSNINKNDMPITRILRLDGSQQPEWLSLKTSEIGVIALNWIDGLLIPVDQKSCSVLERLVQVLNSCPPDLEVMLLNTLRTPQLELRLQRLETKQRLDTAGFNIDSPSSHATSFLPKQPPKPTLRHTWIPVIVASLLVMTTIAGTGYYLDNSISKLMINKNNDAHSLPSGELPAISLPDSSKPLSSQNPELNRDSSKHAPSLNEPYKKDLQCASCCLPTINSFLFCEPACNSYYKAVRGVVPMTGLMWNK